MKKQTLEEVKEYFKDADIVEATNCSFCFKLNIDLLESDENGYVNEYKDGILLSTDGFHHCVYDGKNYARIVSKIKPKNTMKITKEFIRENQDKTIKEVFPDVCKNEFTGWKISDVNGYIAYFENDTLKHGINHMSGWFESGKGYKLIECYVSRPATDKEVEEALIKEAVKRGFKEGVTIKNHQGVNVLKEIDFIYTDRYNNGIYNKQGQGFWVFINGVWADIIETKEPEKTKLQELIEVYESRLKSKEFNLCNAINASYFKSCITLEAEINEIKTFIENLKEL